jgi:hypothetical protein
MRKSGRLASIHDDDIPSSGDNTAASTASDSKTKKFTPTIPAVRRKKVVEEEDSVSVEPSSTSANTSLNNSRGGRKPLNASKNYTSTSSSVVSGPLSMGPAAMARSSRSSGSSGSSSAGIFSARSISRLNTSASSSSGDSKPLNNSVPVEEVFADERIVEGSELLKPVALSDTRKESDFFTHFEPENGKMFLFQMPPVLPTLDNTAHDNTTASSSCEYAEKWPLNAQGRYGKLRRYKSGRIAMILENGVEFLVNPSIENSSDAQNTSVIAIDSEFAQSFNLGQIEGKFVCVPEFDRFQKLSIYE